MKKIPEIGDTITLTSFAYRNPEGGTGISNWDNNPKYIEPAEFKVIKEWNDYECGQRGWAIGDPANKKLMKYLEENVKPGQPSEMDLSQWDEADGLYIVFWSEFNIIDIK